MTKVTAAMLLDSDHPLSLAEFSRACSMHAEWVMELVAEGILDPIEPAGPAGPGKGPGRAPLGARHCRFGGHSLRRALIVRRLQRDLGVNLAGAALALELMEEMEILRARLEARSC